MQTLTVSLEERNIAITRDIAKITQYWQQRLEQECPEHSETTRNSIVRWLLKRDLKRFQLLEQKELEIVQQEIEYRWQIFHKRYLGLTREGAYRNLMTRLGSVVSSRSQMKNLVALNSDRQRSIMVILDEVIQQLLKNNTYIHQQMVYIAASTTDRQLQNTLLLATIEGYALRPVNNQPLLIYFFVNYLRQIITGSPLN